MIIPDKHTDLSVCTLKVSAWLLAELQMEEAVGLETILSTVDQKVGKDARFNVPGALCFLFLVAGVQYDSNADAVVLGNASVVSRQ